MKSTPALTTSSFSSRRSSLRRSPNKKLAISAFIPCDEVDTPFFDKPYYLLPSGPGAAEPYAIVRDALEEGKVTALAHAVLFRRYRGVMIRPAGGG